ncbi:MAG: FG-GAP-like repeat-containing protein [Planctomycetota bacterium]|nr:FG-GAP-like repeat-containing protein [Planctomycetota bacterium]
MHGTPIAVLLLACALSAQGERAFVERAQEVGLDHRFMSGLDRVGTLFIMHDWVQVGMAPGDTDGDGDLDLLTLGRLAPNHMWRNDGGAFADDTDRAGVASPELDTCCAFGDWDRDGDLDLVIGVYEHGEGPLPGDGRIYRNDGTGAFEDVSELAGRVGNGHTTAALWLDLDHDGLLDLVLSEFDGTKNLLYRNLGGGFLEVGAEVGANIGGSTHVTGACDTDGDGFVDLHVGNDHAVSIAAGMADTLGEVVLQGNADGTYTDVTQASGLDWNLETMGLAWGDVNYDGLPDIYKTEVGTQHLEINNGWPGSGLTWMTDAYSYGVDAEWMEDPENPGWLSPTVGWGTVFADVDLDLWLDLFFVAGHVCPSGTRNQHNFMFRGDGPAAQYAFTDVTKAYGLYDEIDDRSLVSADLDHDGDIDFLIGPPGGNLRYFENQLDPPGRGWLAVVPACRTSAPGGGGVVVQWTDSLGHPHTRWIGSDGQTASQNEPRAHFGMGAEPFADVRVAFPSGVTLEFPLTPPDTEIVALEPELIRLSATSIVLPVSGSGLSVSPLARGVLEVTALAHDPTGKPLDASTAVSIDIPGLAAIGPVESVGGNEFRRRFASGPPGTYRVTVIFDAFGVRTRPRFQIVGAPTAATTLRIVPEAVRAGSNDPYELRVVPRDANGALLGAGHHVEAQVGGGVPFTLQDRGDGRYVSGLVAPSGPGPNPVHVFVDGAALGMLGTLEVGGAPSSAASWLYFESPVEVLSLNRELYQLLVTPRDDAGMRLGPGCDVQVLVHPDPNSVPVSVRTDLGPNAQDDGDFYFVLEKPAGAPADTALGTYQVFVDGVLLGEQDFLF